ncbi:NADP oxidoreductase coenzyme F420-dependent family protein [Bordetella holmesii 30539]|uniref:NADP oxidoreductase coenzyme F420-dependent n=2 Tax=Bordetella holmesii TaxID=35814 RepID=A0A158M6G2_9BORD|nr:NADP oxidoreductase coenzyme F420-dependent family protein [Bordetella holmesii ATCC 51541]AIT25826.1 NADP oxidoreductase coenzyme F420-dependent family protein [Bordetella holmesii 44057]EWM42831.1 NADP oxidoreductase coenzyme F420-dependent family protein [Bordetella holmesii 41130]EWM46394.1 NADP oxidoreductase coenzyme F420-dependent family protein [Bordetella holmesii 35009]EWM50556.1 NADP oxidoreductase coenzyme F420-dependent family protein [Bordetella holmesii 70147]EXF89437.1 NADP 
MKILIVGAGRVGTSVAENLVSEENDITVVDVQPGQLGYLQERFDLRVMVGDATQVSVLEAAGAADTDLLIACAKSGPTSRPVSSTCCATVVPCMPVWGR